MKPLVSVVIPAYNCETFVEASVRSAMAQSVRDIEILVVDDGSTDGTAAVVEALCREDERVNLIRPGENRGVAEARNLGVRSARADWVAFLDSDDLWLPEKLEKQLSLRDASGASLLYTGASCIDHDGAPLARRFTPPEKLEYRTLLRGNEIVCSTVLARRELLLTHPMVHSELHEDYICWLQILRSIDGARGLSEGLILYRMTDKSKSRDKKKSARMTWDTYAYLGIPFARRCLCFLGYVIHGIRRYYL